MSSVFIFDLQRTDLYKNQYLKCASCSCRQSHNQLCNQPKPKYCYKCSDVYQLNPHWINKKKKKKLQNENKKLMEAKNRMRKINTNIDAPCVPDELTPER